jgi:leucyl-tRNA synthetase
LRYLDPHNDQALADSEKMKQWLPVDLYVGGAEHAVLHLLYARFWHMVLYDVGAIPKECGDEPFVKLKNQGLILGEDGEKMSKSRGNVINPDPLIEKYGADSFRMYEMFMGPFEDAKPWSTNGLIGVRRFLDRVWRAHERVDNSKPSDRWHKYAKQITEGIENFRFNTCVSDLMKWVNEWGTTPVAEEDFGTFLKLLSPFAPHVSEELWSQLGHKKLLAEEKWPTYDPKKVKEETVTIAVQVMGKLRGTITVNSGADQKEVEKLAKIEPNVAKYLTGKPKKVIFVKDRLINFVI